MAEVAIALGDSARQVLISRDPQQAARLREQDDAMDELYRNLFSVLLGQDWTDNIPVAVDAALLGRFTSALPTMPWKSAAASSSWSVVTCPRKTRYPPTEGPWLRPVMTTQTRPDAMVITTKRVAAAPVDEVLRWLDSSPAGLSSAEAAARLTRYGPNAVRTHRVNPLAVLGRQLRNAVLMLLAGTAVVSFFLGDSMQAVIIGVILAASIGLGFVNEYRAERAAAALHAGMQHKAVVRRDGEFVALAVTALVPGDVVRLSLGRPSRPTSGSSRSAVWNATKAS